MPTVTMDLLERYGLTGKLILENALQKLLNGKASIEEALDYIMEFARGQWSLIIDENLESLADVLAYMNYDAQTVPKGTSDEEIRRRFAGRGVFITSNDRDFSLDEVPDPFERGMVLVPNGPDDVLIARAIESVLMTWRKTHGAAPVRRAIQRGDL
jgi:hypothetical protein